MNAAERNNAGIYSYEQGAYNEAVNEYQAAQVVAPDLHEPYLNIASVYVKMGELAKARAALEQALKSSDDSLAAQAYYDLGNVYFEMQLYGDAVEAYKQTLFRAPDDNDARYNLELALDQLIPPTDTPVPQSDNSGIPTPPSGDDSDAANATSSSALQTATPTLGIGDPESDPSSTPYNSDTNNSMSVEEASSLLDAVQQNQSTLGRQMEGTTTPGSPVKDKDW